MKAKVFDAKFDSGKFVGDMVDWSSARRLNLVSKRVNVDFPAWVVESLDSQARHLGVTRQALIRLWIAERLGRAQGEAERNWQLIVIECTVSEIVSNADLSVK